MPDIPQNPICTEGVEKNTLSWDEVSGAIYYNLYHKKDKCPNCYFYNLDDWVTYKTIGTETAVISSEKLLVDIPDGIAGNIKLVYNHRISSGNFEVVIDFPTYISDVIADSMVIEFMIMDEDGIYDDMTNIQYNRGGDESHQVRSMLKLNGNTQNLYTYPINKPTKFKIVREGTILKTYYYLSGWVLIDSRDFGAEANKLGAMKTQANSVNSHGGSYELDNFTITPSVKNSGTKISSITELTYDHESLIPNDIYCYEITAEGSESDPSEEVYGIPEVADPPTEISIVSGSEKNTINFTVDPEADKTHIYWDISPGVTKETGNKISDVSSPYEHTSLDPSKTYYYVLVSENNEIEGNESVEYSSSPIPAAPENPIIVILESGDSENVITCDDSIGAVSYNLYWSTDPDFTKETGTKIEDITRPYNHQKLIKGKYYYIITAVNAQGESEASDIIEGKIDFDGKEFEHIVVMLRRTLQQYKG